MMTDGAAEAAKMPSGTPAAFSARGLTKIYGAGESAVHALRGVDIDLHEGDLVVLLGPSGSGKSTLLNILGGLDRPTSGTLFYRDTELTAGSDRELTAFRRRHVGFIFQFYNLIPSLTARENVALVTELVDKPMVPDDALRLVGLGERMDHFPAQLSGGEQQRVAVARAVAKRPHVLLCDEPTGASIALQACACSKLWPTSTRRLGTTTVVITHNATIAGWPITSCASPTAASFRSRRTRRSANPRSSPGEPACRHRPEARARHVAPSRPGAGDRARHRLGGCDARNGVERTPLALRRPRDLLRSTAFCPCLRQPEARTGVGRSRLRDIPGVAQVETRVARFVTIEIEGVSEPLRGLALSLPEHNETALNALVLRNGRFPDPDRPSEVLLHEAFADRKRLWSRLDVLGHHERP